ncbi:MAG: methionine gamma-lyase family protein [Clostridia bacterium]|nr:methionine gamma-lyase family protein [Clostridia bacterium]
MMNGFSEGGDAFYRIDGDLLDAAVIAEDLCAPVFKEIDARAEYNQYKVIKAFQNHRISETHFIPTTGYGYGDRGRDALDSMYAEIFGTEDALVRQSIASGTVANTLMMFANLRPGDEIVFAAGKPYDTLLDAVGIRPGAPGSMKDYGITHKIVSLTQEGGIDHDMLAASIGAATKMVFIQRSRGYDWRKPVMVDEIEKIVRLAKAVRNDIIIAVDNCYGEFVEKREPGQAGADIMAGSLIKNPGGGLCPSGGYICGRKDLIENCASRLYSPGLSKEVGASVTDKRLMFQGLFMAPHTVGQSLRGAVFTAALLEGQGYGTSPAFNEKRGDIIQLVRFKEERELIKFCEGVQKASPVDSQATPVPWDMPGYSDKVIMAAGTFVQGASIEFSADAPVRSPYIAYMQGGLVYSQVKLGVLLALQSIRNDEII